MESARKYTILVINDASGMRGIFREVLEYGGYNVLDAGGNDEALSILEKQSMEINLVIQDCGRPLGRCLGGKNDQEERASGVRFYREILLSRFPHIPVLFCSGYSPYCLPAGKRKLFTCFWSLLRADSDLPIIWPGFSVPGVLRFVARARRMVVLTGSHYVQTPFEILELLEHVERVIRRAEHPSHYTLDLRGRTPIPGARGH
jgi:CheY-like chemotaxis protein